VGLSAGGSHPDVGNGLIVGRELALQTVLVFLEALRQLLVAGEVAQMDEGVGGPRGLFSQMSIAAQAEALGAAVSIAPHWNACRMFSATWRQLLQVTGVADFIG
jgi:hypothetical protein